MTICLSVSTLGGRRERLSVYATIVLVLVIALSVQAVTVDSAGATTNADGRWTATAPDATADTATVVDGKATTTNGDGGIDPAVGSRNRTGVLVTVQSYGGFGQNNGRAVLVQDSDVIWSFAPENSRVFDAEVLANGNVLVAYATKLPANECPERTLEYKPGHCVRNNVVEVDFETAEEVWAYRWYDAFIAHHEVHDADRLPNGETAIVDMGNDRAFVVNDSGAITWNWSAREHIGPGSEFWKTYGGPAQPRPESDWTHMNDIDLLENGRYALSIRNFDVILEVNRSTKAIDRVIGEPRESGKDVDDRDPILDDQHNMMYVEDDHVVVADSEADRIVEVDASTNEVVWTYEDGLLWPRDADRLPNGNTLVTNSLRYEVVELTSDGDVVWRYQVSWNGKRGIPYEADRVSLPEEPNGMPALGANESRGGATPDTEMAVTATAKGGDATSTPDSTSAESVGDGESDDEGSREGENQNRGFVDRLGGYAFLYVPFWMGSFEVAMLGMIAVVGLVAIADGIAYFAPRLLDAVRP